MWEEEREVRLRSQLGPHHKGPHKSIFFTFVSKDNGKGRGMYGGKILSGVASGAASLFQGSEKEKDRTEKKDKVICGCVEAEAFVGLRGSGNVSKRQMENQVWISEIRPRSY